MANPVGSLLVRIGGDTTDLDKSLDRSQARLSQWSGKTRNAINVAGKFAAAAGAAAVGGMAVMVNRTRELIDEQAKLGRQIGATQAEVAGLTRVGKDAGIETGQMASNIQALNKRLGEAQEGSGEAAGALEKLGLSADELANMPLAQRMDVIGRSINNLDTQTEKAAVTADLFSRSGLAMLNVFEQGEGAIARATEEAQRFGLAVSDIDAAKVEAANDAMDRISDAVNGAVTQLTVELAPILKAISEDFTDAAQEAGGFGEEIRSAVDGAVRGIGVMLDGLHGTKVLVKGASIGFQALGNTVLTVLSNIYEGWSRIFEYITSGLKNTIELANRIPGVNIDVSGLESLQSGFRNVAEQQQAIQDRMSESLKQNVSELHDMLMQPLPSEQLQEWVDKARQAAEEAAQAMAASTGGGEDGSGGGGMTEEERKAQEEKAARLKEQMEQRLEILRDTYATERELSLKKMEEDLEQLKTFFENDLIKRQEYNQLKEEIEQGHQDRLSEIDERAQREREQQQQKFERLRAKQMQGFFGDLESIAAHGGDRLFQVAKIANAAKAFVDVLAGQAAALKLGWPQGPIAAAAIGAQGFALLSSIKSATSSGGGGSAAGIGGASASAGSVNQAQGGSSGEGDASRNVLISVTDDLTRSMIGPIMNEIGEQLADGGRLGSIRVV